MVAAIICDIDGTLEEKKRDAGWRNWRLRKPPGAAYRPSSRLGARWWRRSREAASGAAMGDGWRACTPGVSTSGKC